MSSNSGAFWAAGCDCFVLCRFCLNSVAETANPIHQHPQESWGQNHRDWERMSPSAQSLARSGPGQPGPGLGHRLGCGHHLGDHRRGERTHFEEGDLVPEENPRQRWHLAPGGGGAERAAVRAPISPEKQANRSRPGLTLQGKKQCFRVSVWAPSSVPACCIHRQCG